MKRFRFTLIAVCLLLLYLGWSDTSLFLRNRAPASVTIADLGRSGAPREWLHVTGGTEDLEQAISTTGSVDLDALLVPLKSAADAGGIRVLVETRDPQLMELFKTYHFKLDSALARERYLEEHRAEFHARRDLTGMVVTGLIATGNRDKLLTLAKEVGLEVGDDVIFISEGKEPSRFRGFFFLAVAVLGLLKLLTMKGSPPAAPRGEATP